MFFMLRKRIMLALTALASIAVWEQAKTWESAIPLLGDKPAVAQSLAPAMATPAAKTAGWPNTGERVVLGVLFVVLVPVLTAGIAGRVMARGSNGANLAMLLLYTTLDVLAAYALSGGFGIQGTATALGCLLGLAVMLAYNLWILSTQASLREA
jgi:hypothetical protein